MPTENDPRGHWMITFTGRRFYPGDPRANDVCIEDVAHALSRICRFGGHSREHYSVAQHSVYVADAVAAFGGSRLETFHGLLHDAAEAYVGDVVWPLKRHDLMAGYAAIEGGVETAIAVHFGLPLVMPPIVKRCDLVLLATEKRDVMGHAGGPTDVERQAAVAKLGEWHSDVVEPLPEHIVPLPAAEARALFLRRFEELS